MPQPSDLPTAPGETVSPETPPFPGLGGHEPQALDAPLSSLVRRPPVVCGPQTPLREALGILQAERVSTIVVVEDQDRPVGIFSLRDLISRVLMPGTDMATPLRQLMTPNPIGLPPDAHAFQAALIMAEAGIHHVLIVEKDRLKGVVAEKDLFSLQRVGVTRIATHIRAARDVDALQAASGDIQTLARNMLIQGVNAEQLTLLISTLNDQLTQRIIQLELEADADARALEFCWLALGSEGRLEQTLSTDQDNGIIFTPPQGTSPEDVRKVLLPFAKRVNDALAACGFPLCKGEIMASNPKWCLSLEEWQSRFSEWIFRGDAPVLLNATIFFDFRALAGAGHLADSLRAWLNERLKSNRQFLKLLTLNALGNRPPLGLVRDFVVDSAPDGTSALDLKLHGATPFVDAARVLALMSGCSGTGTAARLRACAPAAGVPVHEVEAWLTAFFFIQMLRLRRQQSALDSGQAMDNRLDPETLNGLEKQFLKESFRQAKKLQAKLDAYFKF